MAARHMRWLLLGELLIYAALGGWVVVRAEWTPLQAGGLALTGFFGVRLLVVAVTYSFMLTDSDRVPGELQIGPLRALRMLLEDYAGLILLFSVVQPFEAFWLGPDHLARRTGRRPPLLLIHGYQCNRGFWFWLRPKLEAAGWVAATHNLEPVWAEIDAYAPGIARRIDEVLAATGAPQVILVGHSMGGVAARAYLRRHGRDKVARLVTLGSPHQGTRLAVLGLGRNARQLIVGSAWLGALAAAGAASLPPGSTSIYSVHDNYVFPQRAGAALEGAASVAIGGVSHLGMAFSPQVLDRLLQALESP